MIDKYPLEDKDPEYKPELLFEFRNYINIVPAFLKSVNFCDFEQVLTCYDYLEKSEKA